MRAGMKCFDFASKGRIRMADTYETLIYRQKQALHYWKAELGDAARPLTPKVESAVWDLLLLCADDISDPSSDTADEITRVAYDLAVSALETFSMTELYQYFRDDLVSAVLKHIPQDSETASSMIRISNLISDAFRDAYADRLRRTISRQRTARVSEELQLAKRIQERLLPKSIPYIPGFQLAGKVIPARDVGGDYWSAKYYPEDGVTTMKLADISGHGIAAATLVAAVKFISGGYYRGAKSASEVISRTNKVLVRETPVEILVTMVYAWLYPEKRELDIVNAGHEPVFLCKENLCIDIPPTGPVLGVTEADYGEIKLKMATGDILFFCSDGITEAGSREQFGTGRVKDVVLSNRDRSADEIANAVITAATDFGGPPRDDMSIVVLKAIDEDS